jgi:hypothetical protein
MSNSPCAPRAHQFIEIDDLTHTEEGATYPRTGILIKCAYCGEERELWKGEELSFRSPGSNVSDTPEADTEPTMFIKDYPQEP